MSDEAHTDDGTLTDLEFDFAQHVEQAVVRRLHDIHGLLPNDEPTRSLTMATILAATCIRLMQRNECFLYALTGGDEQNHRERVEAMVDDIREACSLAKVRERVEALGGTPMTAKFAELYRQAQAAAEA